MSLLFKLFFFKYLTPKTISWPCFLGILTALALAVLLPLKATPRSICKVDCYLLRAYIPFGCLPWRETAGHKLHVKLVISPCKGNKYTAACCFWNVAQHLLSMSSELWGKNIGWGMFKNTLAHLFCHLHHFFEMNENLKNTLKRSSPHLNLLCALSWLWRKTRVLFSRKLWYRRHKHLATSHLIDAFITDMRAAVVQWNW